jgi:tetratricopeptide (TPR) repeat protein
MTPEELAQALIAAPGTAAREALLAGCDVQVWVPLARVLKDLADDERLHNPTAAAGMAAIVAEVASASGVAECQALAEWAQGNVLIHLGHYEEALRLYRGAASFFVAHGQEVAAARLAANQVFVLKHLGRYQESLQVGAEALGMLRQHPPSAFLASVLTGMGGVYRVLRRYDDALAVYAESAAIQAALGDEVKRARVAINQANVLENLDRFDEALALLAEARAALDARGRSLEVARADLNLGILYTRLGRYDDATRAFDSAELGFAALDVAMEVAVVALYRADLYAEFNLYDELLATSAAGWHLFEERQMRWQAARGLLHQGVAWRRLGNAGRARALLDEARTAFVQIGDPVWRRLAEAELALLRAELGEWTEAVQVAEEASAFFTEQGMALRATGSALLYAEACLGLGRLEDAADRCREVLVTAQALAVPTLLYKAHHGLGRAMARMGRLEEAFDHLARAVETIESQRLGLRVEDFRLGFFDDKLGVYHDAVSVCLQLGRVQDAFAYVERAKSGALVDLLLSSVGQSQAGARAQPELLERLKALGEELNWHYSRTEGGDAREEGGPGVDDARLGAAGATRCRLIFEAEQKVMQAWRQVQQASPFYAALDRVEPCTVEAVARYLHPGDVLIQYLVTGEAVYAFVVGGEGLRGWRRLASPPSTIEEAGRALQMVLRGVPRFEPGYVGALERLARQQLGWLYDDLLEPLAPLWRGAARLLIAPDGVLFEVPFQALHDGEGYLLERCEVAYTPSAAALGLCAENYGRRRGNAGSALVMGYSRGGELTHLLREAEAVGRALPGARTFLEEEATRARLQECARQCAVVHLATHGVFRRDNPLFSTLQLAGGDWLRATDFYDLHLDGALVTLSGCDTGRHRLRGGDVVGLGRGLLAGGAAATVASLWPVDDASTAELMASFYARLAAGESAAAALRAAQLTMLKGTGEPRQKHTHPYYWAPFYLMGAPDVQLA